MSRNVNRSKKRQRVMAKKKRLLKRRRENAGKVVFACEFDSDDGYSINSELLELLKKQSANSTVKVTAPDGTKAKLLSDILNALNPTTGVSNSKDTDDE